MNVTFGGATIHPRIASKLTRKGVKTGRGEEKFLGTRDKLSYEVRNRHPLWEEWSRNAGAWGGCGSEQGQRGGHRVHRLVSRKPRNRR